MLCSKCNQSEDALIEGCCEPLTCAACGGQGWLFSNAGNDASPNYEIQRCDGCKEHQSDQAALEAVVKAAKSQPGLLRLAETIAQLLHEGEPDRAGEPFEASSEDTIAALNQLILEARQLLGVAEKCGECRAVVAYVIGCPDGAEICQDCFDAGQH